MAEKKKQPITTAPPARTRHLRRFQNFLVVWLDDKIDEVENKHCQDTILQLNEIVKDVITFTDIDECVDFISDIEDRKVFLISSSTFGQRITPVVNHMSQVSAVYIFCDNGTQHEQWVNDWPKVGGVFTKIKSVCEALKRATVVFDQTSVAMSFVAPTAGVAGQRLDELDHTFMYTQILKEILLNIDFNQSHIADFFNRLRTLFVDDANELPNVDKLEREYDKHSSIWCYTCHSLLYTTLNRALRLMEVDFIISMGFFVRELHEEITKLHAQQFGGQTSLSAFTVYRGQGLVHSDFDRLVTMKGGLLSFNNFLSTSTDSEVSLAFARSILDTLDLVGILFVMHVDPYISSTPFASVRQASNFEDEDEILFSMHSVFRIENINQLDGNNRLWQVNLTLTRDDDPQLRLLTNSIRQETTEYTGWGRLSTLLYKLGQFDHAQSLCEILLNQASTAQEEARIYSMLGLITNDRGDHAGAIILHQKCLHVNEKTLLPTNPEFATSYNNIGLAYHNMGKHSQALEYYEKAFEIWQNSSSKSS